jgi:hypothetical protein
MLGAVRCWVHVIRWDDTDERHHTVTERLSPATRFFRATRAAAVLQLRGEYDEATDVEYEAAREAMFRAGYTAERVDAVDALAVRAARRDVQS